jgi:hypothetical protein
MSAEDPAPPQGLPVLAKGAIVGALVLGALLRFAGLGFGLRHRPHWDERVFVVSVSEMLAARDLDHRFYEYPGLLSYLLAPLLALLPPEQRQGPEGYLLARGLVAAFGVVSIALSAWLGRRLAGSWGAAAAALLVAVSPVEVVTAHTLRPDVVLESFVLLALLAFTRLGGDARGDVRSGLAVGAATAVKFSGALLAPAYAVARALAPGPRVSRLLLAGAVAVAVFFLATPFALIHAHSFFGGMRTQWTAHYSEVQGTLTFGEVAAYYGWTLVRALGAPGVALLLLGTVSAFRAVRQWAPLVTQVAVMLLVFSTADRRYERFLVPVLGLLAVLAGEGVRRVAGRHPALGAAVLAAAVAWPLGATVAYVRDVTQPGTRDQALDFVLAHSPEGTRVLNQVEDLGLPAGRFEVVDPTGADELDRLLVRGVDVVIWAGPAPRALEGAERLLLVEPRGPASGPGIGVYRPRPEAPAPAIPLSTARLSASSNPRDVPLLADGRLDTEWVSEAAQKPGDWLQVELEAPATVSCVELMLGSRPLRYGRNLHVLVSEDGATWTRVRVASGRPPVEAQSPRGEGASQRLWIEPRRAKAVRLLQAGSGDRRWGVAELRLY